MDLGLALLVSSLVIAAEKQPDVPVKERTTSQIEPLDHAGPGDPFEFAQPVRSADKSLRVGEAQDTPTLKRRAEEGDANAQNELGLAYCVGKGVPRDFAKGVNWLKRAAEQGHTEAQRYLGSAYNRGIGVPQDYVAAVSWYRRAADKGDAFAQSELGWSYYGGKGVPQDYAEAVSWYKKAASQGLATAQNNLGVAYAEGKGVPQDYAEAYFWANLAAASDRATGHNSFAKFRDEMHDKVPRTQLSRVQKRCRQWLAAFEKRKAQRQSE